MTLIAQFTVPGEPVSKARARFTGYGSKVRAYTPEKTHTAERAMAWSFRTAVRGFEPTGDRKYAVHGDFFAATLHRRDVDNMMKLVLDGLNKIAWEDDTQVVEIVARKHYVGPEGDPRTVVAIYDLGPVDRLTRMCEQCGGPIRVFRSTQSRRKFCSNECALARRRAPRSCQVCGAVSGVNKFCSDGCRRVVTRVRSTCTRCGADVETFRSWAKNAFPMCSTECRVAYWRDHRAVAARGTCSECAGPTSKKSYTRCRACLMAKRGDQ